MSGQNQVEPLLAGQNISFAYADAPTLTDVSLALAPHCRRALIGPNGSGKTTLLKLLAGILTPTQGAVEWQGRDIRKLTRREMARRIALVPQELNVAFGFTVREMVLLGRTPHLRAFAGPTRRDHKVVEDTLELTETSGLADRLVTELSGGEKQRAVIAMALAQEPEVLLLDEPTVHLDINHQIEILELLQRLNRDCGLTVLATMHDLNLAALYFDELVMLKRGRVVASGAPVEVLSAEQIQNVFDARVHIQPHPLREDAPQVVLLPNIPMT
jgi:cobalamin transport system ATP-binding protein